MKKILAVLLVLAMALSLSAVAFAAENSYCVIEGVEFGDSMSADQVIFNVAITDGTTISLDFRPMEDDWVGLSIRDTTTAKLLAVEPEYDDAGELTGYKTTVENKSEVISVDEDKDIAVVAGNDGWYTVTFTVAGVTDPDTEITGSDTGLFIRFYYDDPKDENGQKVIHWTGEDGHKSIVHIDNFKVGSKVCSFDETNVVEFAERDAATFKFDDGTDFTAARSSQMHWKMYRSSEGDVEDTEDATEDVEKTGVVSVAVVAVAAVVGGAVVLKKREF